MKKKLLHEIKLNSIFSCLARISLNYNCKKIVLFKMSLIFLLILGFFIFTVVIFEAKKIVSAQSSPDAIAIRVIPNPNNYSPERWYNEQSFSGSPQLTTVDGYQAVRDGRTVYVNAANIDLNNGTCSHDASMVCTFPGGTGTCSVASAGSICRPNLYTNIYLISYNQDAENETIDIFGRILKSWMFNTNLPASSPGVCSIAANIRSDCTGTIGCWHFDGDFLDSSGNSNNGTASGAVSFSEGIIGQSIGLNGVDQFVNMGNSPLFSLTNKATLMAWIKVIGAGVPPGPHQDMYIMGKGGWASNPYRSLVYTDSKRFSFVFRDTSSSIMESVGSTATYKEGKWHNITVTFDGDTQILNLYIDGQLEDSQSTTLTSFVSNAEPFLVGMSDGIHFYGNIDEVKIYDRVLDNGEISTEYNSTITKCQTDDDCLGQGYCDSFKARITRDVLRLSDFTDVDTNMDNYKRINNKYPILDSGTYLTNKTISAWPSWAQSLASELGNPIPVDPINKLGSCPEAGYDPDTCWDEVTKSFADPTPSNGQFNLPNNSYAYVYESLANGDQYNLCANMETGATFNNIAAYNCASNVINNTKPVITKVNIPQGIKGAPYKGYIEAIDPDGDILTWSIDTTPSAWPNWAGPPAIQSAGVFNQREISSGQVGDIGSYDFIVRVDDGRGGTATCDNTNGCTISVVAGAICTDNDTDGFGSPADPSCPKGNILDCNDNDGANYPGNTEDCSTNNDNDCDGLAGCLDPDCFNDPICPASCNDGNCEVSRGECSMACATSDCQSVDCCGDGNVDLPMSEECDDGNTITNDACNSCVKTFCGDGIIQDNPENGDFIKEKCDDGNTVPGDGCDDNCQVESFFNFCVPGSGDGICPLGCLPEDDPDCGCLSDGWCGRMCTSVIGDFLYDEDCNLSCGKPTVACGSVPCCDLAAGEDCISCSADCGWCEASCGDAICDASIGEDIITNPNYCSVDCIISSYCGDGVVDVGEECDDGNTVDGDGCNTFTASCLHVCGDGSVDTGEYCDDGNTIDGDGCNTFTANCLYVCGDGSVVALPGTESTVTYSGMIRDGSVTAAAPDGYTRWEVLSVTRSPKPNLSMIGPYNANSGEQEIFYDSLDDDSYLYIDYDENNCQIKHRARTDDDEGYGPANWEYDIRFFTPPPVVRVYTQTLTPTGRYIGTWDDFRGAGYNSQSSETTIDRICQLAGYSSAYLPISYSCVLVGPRYTESRNNDTWGLLDVLGQGWCQDLGLDWVDCIP